MKKALITGIALLVVLGLMGSMVLANGAEKYDLVLHSDADDAAYEDASGFVIINFTGAGNDEVIANIQVSGLPEGEYEVRSGGEDYGEFTVRRNGRGRINIKVDKFEGGRINIWHVDATPDEVRVLWTGEDKVL